MGMLITAFTGFGKFAVNPSVEIAAGVSASVHAAMTTVEVSFAAADRLIESLRERPPEVLLMIGVAGESGVVRVERVARNRVGTLADVRGQVAGPGEIVAGGPERLTGGLLAALSALPAHTSESFDAGDYLCNYLYYRALSRLPSRSVFVHVAPVDRLAAKAQVAAILSLLRADGVKVAGGDQS